MIKFPESLNCEVDARVFTLRERLDGIDNALVELIALADSIENKIIGPQPCCQSEGRGSDNCIEDTVNKIADKIHNLHNTLLHINERL